MLQPHVKILQLDHIRLAGLYINSIEVQVVFIY